MLFPSLLPIVNSQTLLYLLTTDCVSVNPISHADMSVKAMKMERRSTITTEDSRMTPTKKTATLPVLLSDRSVFAYSGVNALLFYLMMIVMLFLLDIIPSFSPSFTGIITLSDASPLPAEHHQRSNRTMTSRQMSNPNSPYVPALHDDVLAELRHCSAKSSKAVQNCYKTYESDVNQYGRRGEPCCAQAKFVGCLHDSLILPCNKYVDRLVKLYIKEKPKNCEKVVYPSITCFFIVNSNIILVVSIAILVLTLCCGLIHLCKCIARCCRPCCGGRERRSR